jgi:hypothetical protein
MFEFFNASSIPFNVISPNAVFQGSAVVGDSVHLCVSPELSSPVITEVSRPVGASETTLTPDGNGVSTSALAQPGVYTFSVVLNQRTVLARVIVFPASALTDTVLARCTTDERRMILHAITREVKIAVADTVLNSIKWWNASLVGGSEGESIRLQDYGLPNGRGL